MLKKREKGRNMRYSQEKLNSPGNNKKQKVNKLKCYGMVKKFDSM